MWGNKEFDLLNMLAITGTDLDLILELQMLEL